MEINISLKRNRIGEIESFICPQDDVIHYKEISIRITRQLCQLRSVVDNLHNPVRLKGDLIQCDLLAAVLHIKPEIEGLIGCSDKGGQKIQIAGYPDAILRLSRFEEHLIAGLLRDRIVRAGQKLSVLGYIQINLIVKDQVI